MAPGKKPLTIDEFEVDAALHSSARESGRSSASTSNLTEQSASSHSNSIALTDGTSLDLTALINASIQSFLAKKGALELMGSTADINKPGPSGVKRSSETCVEGGSKRPCPSEESEEDDDDEEDGSDYEDGYGSDTLANFFGERINSVDDSLLHGASSNDAGSRIERADVRSEGSLTAPTRPSLLGEQSTGDSGLVEIAERSEESVTSPSRFPIPEANAPSELVPVSPALGREAEVEEVVDKDLYVPTKRTPNWSPPIGVMKWASLTFDEEWGLDEVKGYEDRFLAPKEFRHLFTPIPLTKFMEDALGSQYTKDTDYFFNRRETERLMFRSARDICASYGPFFEVLSRLGARGDCKAERALMSEGLLGVASAMHKITRARRELLRRYFKLEIAKNLYSFDPSHSQFFGGSSLVDRVKQAQEMTNAHSSMFFRPKPNPSKAYAKTGSKPYKSSGFRDQASQQKPQQKRRQNRGRGRRGKSGKSGKSSSIPAASSK